MMFQSGKGKGGRGNSRIATRDTAQAAHGEDSVRHVVSRLGVTLIEVLISMFVLLFGLMGVAAIFPVASHYVLEGDKRDRSSGLAQIAFEELKARKVLRPELWLYGTGYPTTVSGGSELLNPAASSFNITSNQGYGRVFVIDALGVAAGLTAGATITDVIPADFIDNHWLPPPAGLIGLPEQRSPVRRLTLDADPNPATAVPIAGQTAETIFRLRDDLAVDQPDAGDRPSVQRWGTADIDPSNGSANNTPTDFSDDTILSRQYTGDYSWLATVVPTSLRALEGLQPAANIKDAFYEVTTVVFYKRDIVPSGSTATTAGSERLIAAEFLNSSELAIYDDPANNPDAVDLALDGIKPTNWVAVMGVNQITGVFMMKWYKILAMDDENSQIVTNPVTLANGKEGRYVMVQGADWPSSSWQNLRVAILPGAIDAYTRVMQVDVE